VQALGLLRLARDSWPPIGSLRQSTGQGQRWPCAEPVMDFLVREPPQRAQQREQHEGLLGVDPGGSASASAQGRWTLLLGQLDRQLAERQQLPAGEQRQRVEMESPRQRALLRRRGNRCLDRPKCRCHGMPLKRGSQPRSRSILPCFPQVRKRPRISQSMGRPALDELHEAAFPCGGLRKSQLRETR
jgi:hypothetical protein